jgi:hypothetical protein
VITPTRKDLDAIFHSDTTAPQKLVLLAMYYNSESMGQFTVVSSTPRQIIARLTGYSERQVSRIINDLEESRAIRNVYKIPGSYTYHLQSLSGTEK